jgi:hypothetical protein
VLPAWGVATWELQPGAAPSAAPVLLVPAHLARLTRGHPDGA